MKVAWVTPLSTRSAIAEYSVHICQELAARCDLVLWAADGGPWRDTDVPVADASTELSDRVLGEYDHFIYNLGDHPGFHDLVLRTSRRRPGVCVLHDRSYDNLMATHRRTGMSPLREVIAGARGILVHARDHAEAVEREWLGPVARIQFPAYPRLLDTRPLVAGKREDRRVLVTLGYVNSNKQIHRVIESISADSELRRRLEYRVVGPATDAEYARSLRRSVTQHNLDNCVKLVFGYQPDDEFARHIDEADAFVNLREPPLESASASFLEQMSSGKPIVVSDLGYFSEVPDETVLKVSAGDDYGLHQRLRQIVDDRMLASTVGTRARSYVSTLTVDRTVDAIVSFLDEMITWRPLLDLTERVAMELSQFGASPDSTIVDQVARQIAPIVPSGR